jgi:cobalamin biosynthesis Mg chelatase CobN
MVFPVFGRARALYALVGQGINADMIKEAAVFLTEGCQCTVKAENPGVDLLVPVRWDDVIEVSEPEEVDLPLVGLGGGTPLAADTANDTEQKISAAESKATESKATEPSIANSTTTESTSLPVADNESVETSVADLERRTEELIGEVNRVSESTEKLLAKTSSPPAPGIGLPIMVMVVLGGIAWVLGMLFKRRS